MTRRRRVLLAFACLLLVATGTALAQRQWGRWPYGGSPSGPSIEVGDWKVDPHYPRDVFTFVRVEYDSFGRRGGGRRGGYGGYGGYGGWGPWKTDWPDSDMNFSYRLQQLTSLKVNPQPVSLRLTDEALFDYPFLYMIEPGGLSFSDEEVKALRRYLLSGGFLMVDDFWGDYEWENFYHEIKRVFPDREPIELDPTHEIFHCVYRLNEKPQVPSIHSWDPRYPEITWESEYRHGGNTREVHFKAIYDDKDRMVVLICHNTDLGDGWEREGEDPRYFQAFSEKKSYPMGINIVTYVMTH